MYQIPISLSILASCITSTQAAPISSPAKRAPALTGYTADPNIAVFGDTYYMYPTTDGDNWQSPDFYGWSSKDLATWTRTSSPILSLNKGTGTGNVPWSDGQGWAPSILERDGTYYFYFSGNNPADGRYEIGAATANSPLGPFNAVPTPMITNAEKITATVAIDPSGFADPTNGKFYIYWGNGKCLCAELNDDLLSINQDTLVENTGLDDYFEAPFVVYRNGLYHLTWSIDDTRSEDYRVGYASSPSPTGPWTSHGIILSKDTNQGILGTGHQSIINVPGTDDWYIAYHRFAIPGGDGMHREVTLDKLNFDPNTGLIEVVVPTVNTVAPEKVQ